MNCMLTLTPVNKANESFEEICAEIENAGLKQLDSMSKNGTRKENQTFYMTLGINPYKLGRHNYNLHMEVLVNEELALQYDVENSITREISDTEVEFIVVGSVKKQIL